MKWASNRRIPVKKNKKNKNMPKTKQKLRNYSLRSLNPTALRDMTTEDVGKEE